MLTLAKWDPEQVRRALRAVMTEKGLSAKEWCLKAELSPSTLTAYYRGTTQTIQLDTLWALAEVADVPVSRLIGEQPPAAAEPAPENSMDIIERAEDALDEHLRRAGVRLTAQQHRAARRKLVNALRAIYERRAVPPTLVGAILAKVRDGRDADES